MRFGHAGDGSHWVAAAHARTHSGSGREGDAGWVSCAHVIVCKRAVGAPNHDLLDRRKRARVAAKTTDSIKSKNNARRVLELYGGRNVRFW